MALIKWYEGATAGDCLEDDTTWNDMITYIQHSACTDFTIYDTCPGTGQAFRFTTSGDFSKIIGHEDAGKDMVIYANDSNVRSRIFLFGDGSIQLDTASSVIFKLDNSEFLNFDVNGTDNIVESVPDDDNLYLKTNGTGVVKFGTYSAVGAEVFDGFIPILDAAGNARKLMTCA